MNYWLREGTISSCTRCRVSGVVVGRAVGWSLDDHRKGAAACLQMTFDVVFGRPRPCLAITDITTPNGKIVGADIIPEQQRILLVPSP